MRVVAFDTETALIKVGRLAPPLTCTSWATSSQIGLEDLQGTRQWIEDQLEDDEVLFVGLNVAFDFAVLAAEWPDLIEPIFQAYEDDRVTDINLCQKLIDIANGQFRGFTDGVKGVHKKFEYSLAALAERFLGKKRDKQTHRLNFGSLRDVPISEWPEGAADYAREDAKDSLDIWEAQQKHVQFLEDQYRQARSAFGLHLVSCWGLRTSAEQIEKLEKSTQAEFQKALEACKKHGLVRANGTRDTKAARARMVKVMAELNESVKHTKAFVDLRRKRDSDESLTKREQKNLVDPLFGISVDEEACESSGDDLLVAYSKVTSLKTIVDVHIPALKNGIEGPIQPRFDPLMETGRTSCKGHDEKQPTNGYQVHNVRRMPGIRECFVARPGTLYADADYSGLELHTFAQTCIWALGKSRLAEALNEKMDPHLFLSAQMLQCSYEEAAIRYKAGEEKVAETRQFAKIGNFGFQGGMSSRTFRAWARQAYRVKFTQEQADHIREAWAQAWPEVEEYFEWIKAQCGDREVATIRQWKSGRVRGLVPFTVAANTFFQGLGADATKDALFAIQKECYADPASPLFDCRMVNYVHDQFIIEVPDELIRANEAAERLVEVMCDRAGKWLPDVPPRAEVHLARCWSKKAKPVRNAAGLLIPWEA